MSKAKYQFGDIVVVNDSFIGVIVRTCQKVTGGFCYKVYVRYEDRIVEYDEKKIKRHEIGALG